jgi:hypothetical protein
MPVIVIKVFMNGKKESSERDFLTRKVTKN